MENFIHLCSDVTLTQLFPSSTGTVIPRCL